MGKERCITKLKTEVVKAIKKCYDPEIPVNVYELGLIYKVNVDIACNVHILMTLTAPNCPAADQILSDIKSKVKKIKEIKKVEIELTFDPPWEMNKMSESAKLELGLM